MYSHILGFPFLDEAFVQYASKLPLNHKCNLKLPCGQGEKQLLREIAKHLGIKEAASFPKRAIQFGAKTAKMFTSNEHGHEKYK